MEKQHFDPMNVTEEEQRIIMEQLLKHDFSKDPTLIRLAQEARESLKKYPIKKD